MTAWNTPSGLNITRSPLEFSNVILPMLRVASEVHFLDRGFNVDGNSLYWQVDDEVNQGRGAHPFHNRYVLSNHCGVLVGYGTDSANAATDAPDTLQIIDQTIFREKLRHSRKRTHPMVTVRTEIVITGK